jgi:hypothetical protein
MTLNDLEAAVQRIGMQNHCNLQGKPHISILGYESAQFEHSLDRLAGAADEVFGHLELGV